MGTVTETGIDTFGVSFQVGRVWKGRLHRDTTLLITPVLEGATVSAFQTGETYLVFVYQPVHKFSLEELAGTSLPVGTIEVRFECSKGPWSLPESQEMLNTLGPGVTPLP